MKIKFCGVTNLEDAENAIDLGVDYLGFVIDFPKSKRSISFKKFSEIILRIRQKKDDASVKIPRIAVVAINMIEKELDRLLESGLVDVLQFHGEEAPEFCEKYKKKIKIWKAFKLGSQNQQRFYQQIEQFKGKIDRFLIDASDSKDKEKSKSSRFQDFELFKSLQAKGYSLILAGGLNPKNIKSYIKKLKPEIVDIASGIEDHPGKKDRSKMEQFIKNIRA